MRLLPILACLLALGGCAGRSTYTVRPYTDVTTGQTMCCEATVQSSRDVGSVTVHAVKQPDGSYTLDFTEQDVSASKPIAAQSVEVNGISNAVSNAAAAAIKIP
jgi:hypothetical protein